LIDLDRQRLLLQNAFYSNAQMSGCQLSNRKSYNVSCPLGNRMNLLAAVPDNQSGKAGWPGLNALTDATSVLALIALNTFPFPVGQSNFGARVEVCLHCPLRDKKSFACWLCHVNLDAPVPQARAIHRLQYCALIGRAWCDYRSRAQRLTPTSHWDLRVTRKSSSRKPSRPIDPPVEAGQRWEIETR